jgi:hypothetical protein
MLGSLLAEIAPPYPDALPSYERVAARHDR